MSDDTRHVPDLRRLFDDLIRFETLLWAKIDETLQRETAVSLGTLNMLLVVGSTPLCRVLDIAEALAITVGGASQAVDRLVKAGLCERRAHPDDRRSSIVELTPDGVAALRRVEPVFDGELERLLSAPLGASGLANVSEAMSTLRRSIALS